MPKTRQIHPDLSAKVKRTIEAGTVGRLIRSCMALARTEPEWRPVGPVEKYYTPDGARLRQRFVRNEHP